MNVYFPVTPPIVPNYRAGIRPTEPSQIDFDLMPISLFIEDGDLSFNRLLFSCNELQESNIVSVQKPSNQFANLLERNFYSIKNANLTFLDTNYHCDIYTSREMVTMEDRVDVNREPLQNLRTAINERIDALDYKGEIKQNIATESFRTDLERIAKRINKDGFESEALYALSFLQHVAKQGKKIIVIQSHGDTDCGAGRWISTRGGEPPIYVDDILEQIHRLYKPDEVGAVYLALCNPDGFPVDLSKVSTKHKIPIVAHKNLNHPEIADVRLYLPTEN